MPSRLVAWGRAEREEARLGSAMSCEGAMAELVDERDESDLVDIARHGEDVCGVYDGE